jgi:hypothetical protein
MVEASPKKATEGVVYRVDPGMLEAWIVGLERKLFVNNEQAARELGVLDVINRFGLPEIKKKVLNAPRGLLLFKEDTNA